MFKLAIIYKDGEIEGKTCESKQEAEDYVLKQSETREIKRADLRNIETDERETIY